jgi:HEAT repeat protein
MHNISQLPNLVLAVNSGDLSAQLEATTQFRKLLSIEKHPPIQEVIESGVIPRLIQFLGQDQTPNLQFEAAWALTNIASGTSEHTHVVINHGAVPIFVQLLSSSNDDVREQAVWALGNIAGDSPACRDLVLRAGALVPLMAQLQTQSKLSMLRNGTWTLSNLCRGKPQPPFELVRPALPCLSQLLYNPDSEVLTDACWALSYLSDGSNDKIQAVIESGVSRRLVELLHHPLPSVQTPALRTVGHIVTGDDLQTQTIINNGALPCLLSLLNHQKKGIRKEACWTISNITAGNKEQIQWVIEANLIPPLVDLLSRAEFDIRKEAAWAVSNATSGGTEEQILYLVQQGCIPPLCELLSANDSKIVTVALEGLENILKVGASQQQKNGGDNQMCGHIAVAGGVDQIDNLQQHPAQSIYQKAVKILETYFGAEDDDEDGPTVTDQQTFSFGATPGGFGAPPAPQQPGFPPTAPGGGFNFGGNLM